MIKATQCICQKYSPIKRGKKAYWTARASKAPRLTGVGNSADNAIKDLQKQYRLTQRPTLIPPP